jgi:hypothetical protein
VRVARTLLLGVLVAVGGGDAAAAAEVTLTGSYKYVGGEPEVVALSASVDRVVKSMSLFVRSTARKRLRKPNLPSAELALTIDPTTITVARSGQRTIVSPRDGESVRWRGPEGVFLVTNVLKDGALLQTVDSKGSHSTNRFTLAEDGVTLKVTTKINSKRLPSPLAFVMTYRKQPAAAKALLAR